MPVYHLQATMRRTDGRAGHGFDSIEIEAKDARTAIRLVQDWHPEAPDVVPDTLMWVGRDGRVLWSLRHVEPTQ